MIYISIAIIIGFTTGCMIGLFITVVHKGDISTLTRKERCVLEDSIKCLMDKKQKHLYKYQNDTNVLDQVTEDLETLYIIFEKIKNI